MANRFPLVVASSTVQEIASGDNLDLSGVGIVSLTSLESTSVKVGSAITITASNIQVSLANTGNPTFRSGVSTDTGISIPSQNNVNISIGGTSGLDVYPTYSRVNTLHLPSKFINANNSYHTVASFPQVGVTTGAGALSGGGMIVVFLTNHYYSFIGYSGIWGIHISQSGFVVSKTTLALGSWSSDSDFDVRRDPTDPTKLQFKVWDSANALPTIARYSILTCDGRGSVAGIGWSGSITSDIIANPFI